MSFNGRSPWIPRSRWYASGTASVNRGNAPFPWIWSSHPLLNVQPGSELTLSGVTQVKIDAVHGRDDLSENDVVSWPGAIGGVPIDSPFPRMAAGRSSFLAI